MNVTKLELCNRVSKKMGNRTTNELKPILENFLDEILTVLSEGKRIEIRGFGVFKNKERQPRLGRNPRTGETVNVPSYIAPTFKFSRDGQKAFESKLLTIQTDEKETPIKKQSSKKTEKIKKSDNPIMASENFSPV